ncbi:DVU0298 family protein [Desulfogranum japonicum]|uniref:DVU0298 family protein n=1 Tax=Desulfogranum japonicum TaxID=231447 RepID=UPI000423660E|nr:DVU0298 family protein [Desulfogranum japonicum]
MSSRALKKRIEQLLQERNLGQVISQLNSFPAKDLVHALFTGICREDSHVRWFAISSMGITVDRLAAQDFEEARIVMRRLLWSLNDESGGIGWGAPETMAEIMYCNRQLAEEYSHMLVSYSQEDGEEAFQDGNFLEHPLLQRGLMWGIGRLAGRHADLLLARLHQEDMRYYLTREQDPELQGLAAWASGNLLMSALKPELSNLVSGSYPISVYLDGYWREMTVGQLATEALEKIG